MPWAGCGSSTGHCRHPLYPHEITALQLFDSAKLTLEIATTAAKNGWELKDASAWNVLHSRGRPVFVDFLHTLTDRMNRMIRVAGSLTDNSFAIFLLPLLLYRKTGMTPPEVFLAKSETAEPGSRLSAAGVGLPRVGGCLGTCGAAQTPIPPVWPIDSGARRACPAASGRQRGHCIPFDARYSEAPRKCSPSGSNRRSPNQIGPHCGRRTRKGRRHYSGERT